MVVLEKKQSHNYKRTKVHFNNGFSPPPKNIFVLLAGKASSTRRDPVYFTGKLCFRQVS